MFINKNYCLFFLIALYFTNVFCVDVRKVIVIENTESKNSLISYITIDGSNYIIKQKKDPKKKFSLILDLLASYIIKDLNIAHIVTILNPVEKFSEEIPMKGLAILCTLAPGKMVRELPLDNKY